MAGSPKVVRIAVAAACFALGSLGPLAVRAGEKKVLFVAPVATPWSARVRAEIEAMGFEIELSDTLAEQGTPTTIAAARVIESPPPRRIELWMVDASSGHLALRAVVQPSPGDDEATETVRASEQLRAFFQPLRESTPAPRPPPAPEPPPRELPPRAEPPPWPPSAPARPTAPPRDSRFSMAGSVAVPFQPGGPGLDVALSGRWMATRRLGIGALVAIPLAASTLQRPQGSASLAATLFGAELSAVARPVAALRLATSAGIAMAWLRTSGAAIPPYASHEVSAFAALPFVGAEIAAGLGDRVSLFAGGRAGVALPGIDVVFAGEKVATWGRPLVVADAGVRVDF